MTVAVVVVGRVIESFADGRAYSGGEGRVRSKLGGDDEEWSQWLGYVPISVRLGGWSGFKSGLGKSGAVIVRLELKRANELE